MEKIEQNSIWGDFKRDVKESLLTLTRRFLILLFLCTLTFNTICGFRMFFGDLDYFYKIMNLIEEPGSRITILVVSAVIIGLVYYVIGRLYKTSSLKRKNNIPQTITEELSMGEVKLFSERHSPNHRRAYDLYGVNIDGVKYLFGSMWSKDKLFKKEMALYDYAEGSDDEAKNYYKKHIYKDNLIFFKVYNCDTYMYYVLLKDKRNLIDLVENVEDYQLLSAGFTEDKELLLTLVFYCLYVSATVFSIFLFGKNTSFFILSNLVIDYVIIKKLYNIFSTYDYEILFERLALIWVKKFIRKNLS